jgi:hypothetical protein
MKVEYRRKTDKIPEELHTYKPEQRRKAFWSGWRSSRQWRSVPFSG